MKKAFICALTVTFAVFSSSSVQAQLYRTGPTATINNPQILQFNERQAANEEKAGEQTHYTQDQKSASDLKMTSGLNLLREAKASLESNNMPDTASYLTAAYNDMQSALPHYHGYRLGSMRAAHNTYLVLANSQGRNLKDADERLDRAITAAQKALSFW